MSSYQRLLSSLLYRSIDPYSVKKTSTSFLLFWSMTNNRRSYSVISRLFMKTSTVATAALGLVSPSLCFLPVRGAEAAFVPLSSCNEVLACRKKLISAGGPYWDLDQLQQRQRQRQQPQYRMVSTAVDSPTLANDEEDNDWKNILPYEKSSHNSVTIVVPSPSDDGNEDDVLLQQLFDENEFQSRLSDTVDVLKDLQKSSVWIQVPMSRARLIEQMSGVGFEFHHAYGQIVKLNLWLRDDTPSKVPEFATHHVGVGAVVVNSRNEILCVRELRRNYMPWKVPGGLADLSEHIPDAAEREVLEETGIATKFHSILSFRHTHGLSNGRSDLYFVCRLDPIEEIDEEGNPVIPQPAPQECEIEDAQWIPLSEYRDMVNGVSTETGHPMMSSVMKVYDAGMYISRQEVHSVVPGRKPNPIYQPSYAPPGESTQT